MHTHKNGYGKLKDSYSSTKFLEPEWPTDLVAQQFVTRNNFVGTSQQIVVLNQEEERSHGCPNHPPAVVPVTTAMGMRDGRRRHPLRIGGARQK